MTRTRDVTTPTHHRLRAILFLAMGATCLIWGSPATAEDCGSPCTVTRAGLPTFRLVNTVSGASDWDLETSAFGVELALKNDNGNTGAFRVEHGADPNTLVIDDSGRVGIGTTVPVADLQINDAFPEIRLNNTSPGGGKADLLMSGNTLGLQGNTGQSIVLFDTRAPEFSFRITDSGRIGLGNPFPAAKLHVFGDARVDGDIAIASSRSLKIAFDSVNPAEILAKLADLPVASWRYTTEEESKRHIGPVAEDFQRLFGLGDGETISVIDAQGVALAAIQGLQHELAERKAEVAALHQADAELRAELDAIKAALASR